MVQLGGGVDVCPVTKEAWEARAEERKAECGGLSVYHCLPDSKGRKWEKCVEKTLVDKGNCPFFTSGGYFDWKSCNSSAPSCPNSSYVTNEVYKYPFCFGNNTPNRPSSEQIHGLDRLALSLVIIGVVVVILLLLGAVILRYRVFKRRRDNQWSFDDDEEFLDLRDWLLSNDYDDKKEEPDLMMFQLGKNIVEIARVEKVNEGKRRLLNEDVRCMVVIGDFGNSVSSTSRFILTECTKEWKDWKCEQYKYTDVPESVTDKTMLYVHGWFGSWNDDLCSLDEANEAC
uniref:Uncharacterized protein LOC111134133 isoform X1 n=1 Tax=Crassostrea virginica TaxID=6565 RepID=A0A8B8EDD1_CRAVI|nr:uncharacterized protein LOC111134133 isoform X1 [Crassostrea virginica]